VVFNNYANIFTMLTVMRQVANHPDLVLRQKEVGTDSVAEESEVAVKEEKF